MNRWRGECTRHSRMQPCPSLSLPLLISSPLQSDVQPHFPVFRWDNSFRQVECDELQMFCMYAVVAVIFTYVYQLTFFAAVMVYTCRREISNRNCVIFTKLDKDKGRRSFGDCLQTEQLAGNSWPPENKVSVSDRSFEKNHVLAKFFRTTYADVLLNPLFRIIILTLFAAYLVCLYNFWRVTKTCAIPGHFHMGLHESEARSRAKRSSARQLLWKAQSADGWEVLLWWVTHTHTHNLFRSTVLQGK